jgi:rod shape-determining protein MreD
MMTARDWAQAALLVFAAALFQTGLFASLLVWGGAADVLLVVVVCLGLLRGSVPGAIFGFFGGLVVDLVTLETLGLTSLVLTLAGFWAGRYAETTGRGTRVASLVAVAVLTVLAGAFGFTLHYLLGEDVVASHALVTALLPAVFLNVLLALPILALVRTLVGERVELERAPEVELVV